MSEIKPVKWEVVSPGGAVTAVVDCIDDMPVDWTASPLYDESALAQARAEERRRWKDAYHQLLVAHYSGKALRGEMPAAQVQMYADMDLNAIEASIRALSDEPEGR